MSAPRWSDDDLLLMWDLGRQWEHNRLCEAAEDIAAAAPLAPPARGWEARVAERIDQMEQAARQLKLELINEPLQRGAS